MLWPTLSTNMVQWVMQWERQKKYSGRKKQGSIIEKYRYDKFLRNFFGEDKTKTKKDKMMIIYVISFLSELPFLDIC